MLTAAHARSSGPPAAAALPRFSPPMPDRLRLSAGPEAVLLEQPAVPLIYLAWLAPAGSHHDPERKDGLATLAAPLMKAGTAAHDAGWIAEQARELGTDILTAVDWDTTSLAVELLPEDLDPGIDLLAEVVISPSFPAEAVETRRRRVRSEMGWRLRQPTFLAERVFHRALYAGTAYSRSPLGTQASLDRITRRDLAAFHRRHHSLRNGLLVAVGSFRSEDLARRLETAFAADDSRQPAGSTPRPFEPPAPTPRVVLVNLPAASQTQLCLGHAGVARSHPDFAALELLAALLGGPFSSRLSRNLRERRGDTYQIGSRFVPRNGPGPFLVSASVATENARAALEEIRTEIERLRQPSVTDAEVAGLQRHLLGRFVQRFQTLHGTGIELARWAIDRQPDRAFGGLPDEIRDLGPRDLTRLARRHLHPEGLTVVACGPAAELRGPMESFYPRAGVTEIRPEDIETFEFAGNPLPTSPTSQRKEVIRNGQP